MNTIDYLNTLYDYKKREFILNYLLNEKNKNKRDSFINIIKSNMELYEIVKNDIKIAKTAIELREYCQKNLIKYDTKNSTNDNYNKLLSNYATLSQELGFTNALQQVIFYTYLLWEGYFSYDKANHYQRKKRNMDADSFSYDVMRGIGVCLNYSSLLNDYLNACSIDSAMVSTISNEKIKIDYIPDIKRNFNKDSVKDKFAISYMYLMKAKNIGNHIFNLISENGTLLAYDPTNLFLLELRKNYEAEIINGKGRFKIFPAYSYLFNPNDNSINILNEYLINNSSYYCPYTNIDYKNYWLNCLEVAKKNSALIEDVYDISYLDILDIADYARNSYTKVKRKNISKH